MKHIIVTLLRQRFICGKKIVLFSYSVTFNQHVCSPVHYHYNTHTHTNTEHRMFSESLSKIYNHKKGNIDKSFLIADKRRKKEEKKKNERSDQDRKFNSMCALKIESTEKKTLYWLFDSERSNERESNTETKAKGKRIFINS